MSKQISILCTLLFAVSVLAQPQRLTFERIGAEQGLGHGAVYGVTQDTLGLIWFATEDGLLYFDGRKIYHYQANRFNTSPVINISQIVTRQSGELWAGYWGKGLLRINPILQEHTLYKNDPYLSNSIPSNFPQCFYEDSEQNLWVGFYGGGLGRYRSDTDDFETFRHDENHSASLIHDHVWALTSHPDVDPDGLWIGTYAGLDRLDKTTGVITHFPEIFKTESHKNRVRALYLDDDGILWIGTRYDGLILLDIKTGEVSRHPLIPENMNHVGINTIYEDREGNVWVGSKSSGLWVLNKQLQKLELYTYQPRNPRSISFNDIRAIYEDRGGIIWIATRGGGVNRVNPYDTVFRFWTDTDNANPNGRVITAIHQQKNGELLLGSKGGLIRLDRGFNVLQRYSATGNGVLGEDEITTLEADQKSNLVWVGTDDGLDRLNLDNGEVQHFRKDFSVPNSLSDNSIRSLHLDQNQRLWVGTYRGGLNLLDRETGTFRHFRVPDDQRGTPSDNNILALTSADDMGSDNLWVGTSQGLLIFNMASQSWERQFRSTPLPSGDPVRFILTPGEGILIVGQNSQGVQILNTHTGKIRILTVAEGLSSNTIQGLLKDKQGNLWVTTTSGLCEYIQAEQRFRVYDQLDGIQGNVFSPGAVFKDQHGLLMVGGVNGLTLFDPAERSTNNHPPPVVFTSFSINNSRVPYQGLQPTPEGFDGLFLEKPIAATTELVLDPKLQFITFDFAALDYANPKKNQYAVFLEGFQDNWTYLGNEMRMTYTHLPPNTYTLRVKAANNDGLWNETGASIRVILKPAFYQTTWFKLLITITLFAIVFVSLIFRFRAIRLRNRELNERVKQQTLVLTHTNEELANNNQQLEEALQTKNKFFSIIAHDLRGPLAVIMQSLQLFIEMFSELSRKEIHEMVQTMEVNATQTFKLLENLLIWSRLQTGTLEATPEKIQLSELVEEVVQGQIPRATVKEITLRLSLADHATVFADREFLGTIMRNLISNAIKFTPRGGQVQISSEVSGGSALIRVADNGIGIPEKHQDSIFQSDGKYHTRGTEDEESSGLGLLLVKEFVEASGGTISFISKESLGTTFSFNIPLDNPSS